MKLYTIACKKSHGWAIEKIECFSQKTWPPLFREEQHARYWLSVFLKKRNLQDFVDNYKIVLVYIKDKPTRKFNID